LGDVDVGIILKYVLKEWDARINSNGLTGTVGGLS
jgi:hypothetical protein